MGRHGRVLLVGAGALILAGHLMDWEPSASAKRPKPKQGVKKDRAFANIDGGRVRIEIRTTSTLFEVNRTRYRPSNLFTKRSAWCEGAHGTGVGERITYYFHPPTRVMGFEIKGGFQANKRLFKINNRPRDIWIHTSNNTRQYVRLRNKRKKKTVQMKNGPETVRWVTFKIKSVYKGTSTKSNDTCITLLKPF